MMKRRVALFICVFFALFLAAGFVHAGQHLRHDHGFHLSCCHGEQDSPAAHGGCMVCTLICRVFQALSRGLAALFVLFALGALKRCYAGIQPLLPEVLPQTPVTLRVKMTN